MNFDEFDIQILKENFEEEQILKIDYDNVVKIWKYLDNNGIYYVKDLFLMSLDLFLLPYDYFFQKFEYLKERLGDDFVDKLGEDISLIEIMYED
ncbi:MAG: hypothetical protein E7173_03300 [Firmicutes bacterium]|nr:hypothetical protein [Bacillota bacterium]